MTEWLRRELIVDGLPVTSAHPLPVDTTPSGGKTVATILDEAAIAAAAITTLADCLAQSLDGQTLAITVKARYNAAAAAGIRVHVITSPTGRATGTHTGGAHATIMTDAAAHFEANALVGLTINNVTDGSAGVITANTETTVTVAALVGGAANAWANGDVYAIDGAGYDTEDWDSWDPAFAANGILQQTKVYEVDPYYIKVLIENLDLGQAVTDVEVIATTGA